MTDKSDEILKKLLPMFRMEAEGHLQSISTGLLALEAAAPGTESPDIIESIFREAHSLKGAARAVNFTEIEAACHSLENVFAGLKDGDLTICSSLNDLLLQIVDTLSGLLADSNPAAGAPRPLLRRLTGQLDSMVKSRLSGAATAGPSTLTKRSPVPLGSPLSGRLMIAGDADESKERGGTAAAAAPAVATMSSPVIKVSTEKLNSVMCQIEELLLPRLAADERVKEMEAAVAALTRWKRQWLAIQPAVQVIGSKRAARAQNGTAFSDAQVFPPLLAYLEGEQQRIRALEDQLTGLLHRSGQDRRTLASMTDSLMRDVKEMQLLPFSSLLDILPRYSRQLAREQGKSVILVTRGGDIEVDRRILEEMKDPLIHLVRNSVDHGIESPGEREAKGKPPRGTITFTCTQNNGMIEIIVEDDGRGMDSASLKAAATHRDLISSAKVEQLGESEAMELAFRSGVTTRPAITDISGRGLGLAIVREKIEQLGGSVTVTSHSKGGAAFHLLLPLKLANLRGVLVRVASRFFVIPSINIDRVLRIAPDEISTVKNRETVVVDEQPTALVWLSDVLELPRSLGTGAEIQPLNRTLAVVIRAGAMRVAFRVDEISGEQEALLKTLGRLLKRVRNVAGVCALGTGSLAPVLNAADLVTSATRQPIPALVFPSFLPAEGSRGNEAASILVVEDSITARALFKHILESAGYRVTTAVDGAQGYSILKTGTFDLVVSDIEMPRIDGFALTRLIRDNKRLADLPVVLVTALDSAEDRERGLDCGANAYIVKGAFDQSNLLEIIHRLVGRNG